jgi:hypothetical protein
MTLDISGGGIGSLATSTEEQAASAAHPNAIAIIRIKNFPSRARGISKSRLSKIREVDRLECHHVG